MSDVDNVQTLDRTRPQFAPAGPRTRWSTLKRYSTSTVNPSMSPKPLPPHPKPLPTISPFQSFPDAPRNLSTTSAPPPDTPSSSLSSERSSQTKSLSSISQEDPSSPIAAPAYNHSTYTPPETETHSRASPVSELSSIPPKITILPQALPKLTPPPPISFDSVAVPWKGMPLEPALWTFNSTELQDIVSRAIRLSAKESFLRLLTLENLDRVLPAELARLYQLKTTTQAQYRFLVQRRTMLCQALNSSAIGPTKGEDGELLVSKLTTQLVETITDCDQRLEELFRINDQIAQINKLFDVHSLSALAVALRKLNTSYARRTRDLNKARQRIFQLEAEIEDAWKEAEKLANELDEYEASGADDAVIETAEIVPVSRSPSQSPPPLTYADRRASVPMPMTPTLLTVQTIFPFSPTLTAARSHHSISVSPVGMNFVFPPPVPKDRPNDDAVSIKSTKSARSAKSAKCYASSLHAARTRSSRASHSSLRLSIGGGSHHGKGPSEDLPPPMPEIPLHLVNDSYSAGANKSSGKDIHSENVSTNSSSTALHYVTSSHLTHRSNNSIQYRAKKRASLDTLLASKQRGSAAIDAYQGRAADDIYVMPAESSHGHGSVLQSSRSPYSSGNGYVDLGWDDDGEIQSIPRTPPFRCRTISSPMADPRKSQHVQGGDVPPQPPPKDSQTLPTAWRSSNTVQRRLSRRQTQESSNLPLPSLPELGVLPPSVPSQAGPGPSTDKRGLLRRSKTLVMIKGFTKRYSASIPPIFNGKPSMKKMEQKRP